MYGDFMAEMKENVELNINDKKRFKVIAAEQDITMKDLLLTEAKNIMLHNDTVPSREREEEENRSSLIINIPISFKEEVKVFTKRNGIKIRDLWVESVNRIIQRYDDVNV